MKKIGVLLFMICSFFSCKSVEKTIPPNEGEVLLRYSKGPCLGGRCPVYDLRVYSDGRFLYKNAKGAAANREITGSLAPLQVQELKSLLATIPQGSKDFEKIRDFPITTLKHGEATYRFHASKRKGALRSVNDYLEKIMQEIIAGK